MTNKKYPHQAWTQMSSPREGSRGGVRALCMDGSAPDPVPAPRLAELCARLPCAFEADASSRPLGRWCNHQLWDRKLQPRLEPEARPRPPSTLTERGERRAACAAAV